MNEIICQGYILPEFFYSLLISSVFLNTKQQAHISLKVTLFFCRLRG